MNSNEKFTFRAIRGVVLEEQTVVGLKCSW